VVTNGINAQSDDFAVAFLEFRFQPCHVAKFGRTNWREILWMREQDRPAITNPFMKIDGSFCGLSGEVGCFRIFPSVVSAVKSGASEFIRKDIISPSSQVIGDRRFYHSAGGYYGLKVIGYRRFYHSAGGYYGPTLIDRLP
jgi:hypothetical protein